MTQKVSRFDVLKEMSRRDLDIRLSPHFVEAISRGARGYVAMGVPAEVVLELTHNESLACVLLIWNKDQYAEVEKSIEEERQHD